MMVRVRVHVGARSEVVGDSTHVQAIDSPARLDSGDALPTRWRATKCSKSVGRREGLETRSGVCWE